jgi:2-dehydro-3-deoxyphosphogluconate aldolase / (4S)-4-hydroxy-2-oxoglutarate aldolase
MTAAMNRREEAVYLTKTVGVLPAIKLKDAKDLLPYAQAFIDGGIRVLEVTMTTPGVLDAFRAIKHSFGDKLLLASGTTLDAQAAYAAIQAGASVIVSPAVVPDVIATAKRYQVACFCGAFTATEVLSVMTAGADMVKIFPAALAGPKYMTNLRMVYPEVNLIPSGGIGLDTAGEFIRCGAAAISGARNFYDDEMVKQHGAAWITKQARKYIKIVEEARATAYPLP